jgi:Subtilase family
MILAVPVPETFNSAMPFPAASGRGLKIAVIDSGVNTAHPHIHAITQAVVFGSGVRDDSCDDLPGHGTAVMAAIQEKAPGGEYYALRLFSTSLRTSTGRMMEAMEWTISNGINLVNLSLGTPNTDHRAALEALVERARAAGVLLVSARRVGEQAMLPGMLAGVIGVEVDWRLARHQYRVTGPQEIRFYASGFPRPLEGRPASRNLQGISFAVANLTGIVARAAQGVADRGLDAICRRLTAEARRLWLDQNS